MIRPARNATVNVTNGRKKSTTKRVMCASVPKQDISTGNKWLTEVEKIYCRSQTNRRTPHRNAHHRPLVNTVLSKKIILQSSPLVGYVSQLHPLHKLHLVTIQESFQTRLAKVSAQLDRCINDLIRTMPVPTHSETELTTILEKWLE